ncbi:serine protease 33-like [Brevipalpus obovatus]|uniref:serine protease 33-like n=1 Tax=Brevipalpus obovatus TaxID=246614 RepID=UPI003D9EE150
MMNRDLYHFSCVIFLLSLATTILGDQCECGLESQSNRVYLGSKVTQYRYPWMALIKVRHGNSESYSQCGGSLIDSQHILTAAHCVFKYNRVVSPSSVEVTLDILNKDLEYGTIRKGLQIFYEPSYRSYNPMGNDIAIIRLQQSVPLNNRILPVCLPATNDRPFQKLMVAGWGVLDSRDTRTSDLNEVQVDYLNKQQCEQKRSEYLKRKNRRSTFLVGASVSAPIPDGDICAINQQTGGDACSGDSGGPLMHKNAQSGRWIQAGIVSGAWDACGVDKNIPGLYTSVAKHRNFITTYANPCFLGYTDSSYGHTLPRYNYYPYPSYNQYPAYSRLNQLWQQAAYGYNPLASGLTGSHQFNDLGALAKYIEQIQTHLSQQNSPPTGMIIRI